MKKFIIISCLIFTGISFAFFSCERNDMYSLSLWYKYPPRIIAADYATTSSYIYISDDNGATWKQSSPQGQWNAVASSSDGMKIVAAKADTGSRFIYTSTDGGKSWIQRFGGAANYWYSLASSDDGSKLIAPDSTYNSGSGYIHFSTDSGISWQTSIGPYSWGIAVISSDGSRAAVNISSGSPDNNMAFLNGSWSYLAPATLPNTYAYSSLASSSDGMKLAISAINSGQICISSDGGASWSVSGSGAGYWVSIASSSDGMKLAAIDCDYITPIAGYIYTSSDGGGSWTQRTSAGNRVWRTIASSKDGTRLAAGVWGGYIYTSNDGGETWIERTGAGTGTSAWSSIVITK